jgi:hypothetical protein
MTENTENILIWIVFFILMIPGLEWALSYMGVVMVLRAASAQREPVDDESIEFYNV